MSLKRDARKVVDATAAYRRTGIFEMGPSDDFIDLKLVTLDCSLQLHDFAFRLGLEDEEMSHWTFLSGNRLTFSGLRPGSWIVEIKSREAGENWSERPLRIPLVVRFPFYLKTWFPL